MSYFIAYSVGNYLNNNLSGFFTSVGEETAGLCAIHYSSFLGFYSEGFPLPLGA